LPATATADEVTAENIFTNVLNVVAETDIDFPVVRVKEAS
jgi:hypothetical protein